MSSIWLPKMTLRDAETLIIWQALAYFGGNKTHTARALKISLRTLRNRIKNNDKLSEYRIAPKFCKAARIRMTQV